jgi:uncharacterized protein YfaT (DUF1175 family)
MMLGQYTDAIQTMGTGTAISTTGTGQITTLSNASTNTANRINIHGSLALGDKPADNTSKDMENWDVQEMRKFVKWFVNMHHPEAIEQFQAIRAIERANEEQAKLQAEETYQKHITDHWNTLAQRAQNAYPYVQVTSQDTQQKSIWDRMKEMAGY